MTYSDHQQDVVETIHNHREFNIDNIESENDDEVIVISFSKQEKRMHVLDEAYTIVIHHNTPDITWIRGDVSGMMLKMSELNILVHMVHKKLFGNKTFIHQLV